MALTNNSAESRKRLARRLMHERELLTEMLERDNYKLASYQSGLIDGLILAAQLMAVPADEEE